MRRSRSLSTQTIEVLHALAARPTEWRYGYELGLELGLKSGSLYPILMRLADRDHLDTSWETNAPLGRPPRHLYRLSAKGLALAATLSERAVAPSLRPQLDLRGAR